MHAKSFVYICMADVPEYAEYLKTCDFDSVFMWHKDFSNSRNWQKNDGY